MIPVKCPGCSLLLQVDDRFAGSEGRCKHCGTKVLVPRCTTSPEPAKISETPETRASARQSVPDVPEAVNKKWYRRRGSLALFSAVTAILIVGLGSLSVVAIKRNEPPDQVAKSDAVSKPAKEAVASGLKAGNATVPAVTGQTSGTVTPKSPALPALVEGDVYQVSEPTAYEWLDSTSGDYVRNDYMVIPVNGYFTVLGKQGDFYSVSISDGTNNFRCRIKATKLDHQKLHHFDKETVLAWQKEQMEAARREAERLAREQRQRWLDEANAIAVEEEAMARRERARAEAEAEQARAELARIQAESAQAQARAAEYQARAVAEAQAQQYILNQQQYFLNQRQIERERELEWQRLLHDGKFLMIGGQVVNPEAGH